MIQNDVIVSGKGPWETHFISKFFCTDTKCQLGFAWLSIDCCLRLRLWLAKRSIDGILNCKVATPLTSASQPFWAAKCHKLMEAHWPGLWFSNGCWMSTIQTVHKKKHFHSNVLALRPEDRCDSCTCSIVHQLWCELMWVVWACEEHATNPKEVTTSSPSTWYDETYILDIFAANLDEC